MISKAFQFTFSSKMLSVIYCGLAVACLNSQSVQANDDLPKAETVLAKYIKATGGQAAYDKIKNRVTKATMSITAQNLELATTSYAAKPNKVYTLVESDVIGKNEEGSNGKVTWSISAQTGPVVKEGKIHESTMALSVFDGLVYWKKFHKEVKCTGAEKVDGKDCYVLKLTPINSNEKIKLDPTINHFDKKTGLLVKTAHTLATPNGDFKMEATFSDYRKIDGIKIPYKTEMAILGQQMVVTVDSVKHNVKMKKDRFDLPDDIKKLVKKDK